jgi:hypothetical protein
MTNKKNTTQQALSVVQTFIDEWLPRSNDDRHKAFGNWAVEQVLWNQELPREQILELTACDHSGDCGIDAWHVSNDGDTTNVSIFQIKDTVLEPEDINHLIEGFGRLFSDSSENERKLANQHIRGHADDLDQILNKANQTVEIDVWTITSRIPQPSLAIRAQTLENQKPTITLNGYECDVRYHVRGISELSEDITVLHDKPIDVSFSIDEDNYFIFETKNKVKTVSLQIPGKVLARWFQKHKTNLFRLNPRYYQGTTTKFNKEIIQSLKSPTEGANFYVYNNGLTILCSGIIITDSGNSKKIHVRDLQIVNGCQTTATIHDAWMVKKLNIDDINVPVRIIESQMYAANIARFTNSQTPMKDSDFKSNEPIQIRLHEEFGRFDPKWFYENKRGVWNTEYSKPAAQKPYKRGPGDGVRKMTKEDVAQTSYAFLGKASEAQESPRSVWTNDKTYNAVFPPTITAAQLLLPYQIYLLSNEQVKDVKEEGKPYGSSLKLPAIHFVSGAIMALIGKKDRQYLSSQDSQKLFASTSCLERLLDSAFEELILAMELQIQSTGRGTRSIIRTSDWYENSERAYINRVKSMLSNEDKQAERLGVPKSEYGFRNTFPFEIVKDF